jgi:hypothetical protein
VEHGQRRHLCHRASIDLQRRSEAVTQIALAVTGNLGVERDDQGAIARVAGSFDQLLGTAASAEAVQLKPRQ